MEETEVIKQLNRNGFFPKVYCFEYVPGGGTARSSSSLGIPEYQVIKSLIFVIDHVRPVLVLMHGTKRVDTKKLALALGVKKVKSCSPEEAEYWSGWPVGSTNPFILKNPMQILVEESIFSLDQIWINGGARGILLEMNPNELPKIIDLNIVTIGC
jgi:Cys-tRNA(Pro) deacylase